RSLWGRLATKEASCRLSDIGGSSLKGCHCERSEAISQPPVSIMGGDCFAAPLLAMTSKSYLDHDFADVTVGFDMGLRGRQLGERKAAVDDRPDPAVAQRRHQIGDKPPHRFSAFRGAAQPIADA